MLSQKNLNRFKYYFNRHILTGYILLGVALILSTKCYQKWNASASNMGPLIFMNTALSNQFGEQIKKSQREWIEKTIKGWMDPLDILGRAIPGITLSKYSIAFQQRTNEGAFSIPEGDDIISLKEDNIYTPIFPTPKLKEIDRNSLNDPSYLMKHFITGDADLKIDKDLLGNWDFKELSQKPIRINDNAKGPKVLIFHTHIKEKYIDEGADGKGVAAVGEELASILENQYGIQTMHAEDSFYLPNSGSVTGAYERMSPVIENILKENPSIEVVIDLHRDGGSTKLVGNYNGKQAAKVMFVNGVCMRRNQEGSLVNMQELKNPYLEDNLAFSLQSQIEGLQYYPDLMRKMYFKEYRYSLHMKPNSLLIEVGNDKNTLQEALNSAEPIAHIISKVLEKD